MNDRLTVDTINDAQLDALYERLDRAEEEARQYAAADSADAAAGSYALRAETAEAERDGAYRERAHLVALLASYYPSVIAPAPDIDEPGWSIAYLVIGGHQASWHISPRDAGLFAHVERVEPDDRRAQWDGHTTEQKYQHIDTVAARLYAEARGLTETPLTGEAVRQMDADPTQPHTGLVVQSYRDHGIEKWVFRCWGTDDGCDGWLSLDHTSQQWAEQARDRHLAEDHKEG
jgi:hypothetical protein